MLESNSGAAIAANLGITLRQFHELTGVVRLIRNDTVVVLTGWELQQDIDGKEVWEAEISGNLLLSGGEMVYFLYRLVIVGQNIWRGSSRTPDWYKVIGDTGKIIFEGEVECPNNPDDHIGWGRYDTFSPIRALASEIVFARLATGRPVVES